MAGETTFAEINGLAKRVYDKSGLQKFRPPTSIITSRIGWDKGTRNIGEAYQVPIVVRPPNGHTYSGSAGGANTLKQARNMVIKQATITPFEYELREQASFAALSRAAQEGEGSFAQLAGTMMKAMKESAGNRLEMSILLGQRTYGEVEQVTDNGDSTADIKITAATWRPGLWWTMGEGATLDSFTSTTKNNASGPIILAGVKSASRTITVTWTGTLGSEIAAGDNLYPEGAYDGTTWYEMPGLIAQARHTSGVGPIGLNATTYSQIKGNTKDVAGPLTFDVMEEACGELRDRGVATKLSFYCANKRFSQLLSELKSMRIIDQSYNPQKQKTGYKSAEFVTPDIGEVELINHPFLAWGEFLLQDETEIGRVGSSDIRFGVPGIDGEDCPVWEKVANTTAAEVILFADQCVINKRPSHAMHGTGITD